MKFLVFTPEKFHDYIEIKDVQKFFPFTESYYSKDPLYRDPKYIQYIVFEQFDIPIAIFSIALKNKPFKNTFHILTYEVNENFQHSGIGLELMPIIKKKLFKNKSISLRCTPQLLSFYTMQGFKIIEHSDVSILLKQD